jgi:hypothetical protein
LQYLEARATRGCLAEDERVIADFCHRCTIFLADLLFDASYRYQTHLSSSIAFLLLSRWVESLLIGEQWAILKLEACDSYMVEYLRIGRAYIEERLTDRPRKWWAMPKLTDISTI